MTTGLSSANAGRDREIESLIETLHATEQRLEALTAGEVDTVANRAGRTLLMRHAQTQLRETDASKQAAILNALHARVALLDARGEVVSVNDAWRHFAAAHAPSDLAGQTAIHTVGPGAGATCSNLEEAQRAQRGVQSVLSGALDSFSMEYASHSQLEQRWFLMTVTRLEADRLLGAIVMHINVTARTQHELGTRRNAELLQAVADGFWTNELLALPRY